MGCLRTGKVYFGLYHRSVPTLPYNAASVASSLDFGTKQEVYEKSLFGDSHVRMFVYEVHLSAWCLQKDIYIVEIKIKNAIYSMFFSMFFCISIWCAGMCACESNASISILWHRGPVDHSLTPSTLAHYHPFSLSLCVLTHTISDLSDIIPVCKLHKSPATVRIWSRQHLNIDW